MDAAAEVRTAITARFAESYPSASVHLKQLGGYNLEIWIARRSFETLGYLDRKALLESVGKDWCDRFGGWECPAIVVREIKAGNRLGTYHCLFRYATIGD